MHPDMWYHLNAIHHHDGCRLVHPTKWDISSMPYHHDGCRLVHPAKWDIGQFRGAFVTDAYWCILSGGLFSISIQFKMSRIDRFIYNSIYHSHSFGFQISHFNSNFSFQRYTQSMYSFHILIHVLISYTHSFHVLISYLLGKLPKYLK